MSVSFDHESLVDLFRNQPRLAVELVSVALGRPVQATRAELSSIDLSETWPLEARADAVVSADIPLCDSVIVEVQRRPDPEKRRVWPAYAMVQRARTGGGAQVLVVTPDEATARWASEPIVLDVLGHTWRPLVVSPANMPRITDPAEAVQCPELAVLSAILHGKGAHAEEVGRAALHAASILDDQRATLYTDLILYAVHAAARVVLESLMSHPHEYKSDFVRRHFGQGERAMLLRLLERRFGPLPEWVSVELADAPLERVEALGDHLLEAASLESLFGRVG